LEFVAGGNRIVIEVAQRSEAKGIPPSLPAVFLSVVEDVAPLAERGEIGGAAVARVMIEVRAGENDIGRSHQVKGEAGGNLDLPAAPGAPGACLDVPPAAVTQMRDTPLVRSAALFAASPCPPETDMIRDLRPVDRVKPAVFGADRHR
ncbi:hypothetical protein LTR94_028872, partial [Friedmanniomyces endolithicus]